MTDGSLDGRAPHAPVSEVLKSPGQPLDDSSRASMESRLGFDFGKVRIHADGAADASAQAVQARAFTVGSHVVFGRDQYAPHTRQGRELLTHELVHTAQQDRSGAGIASGRISAAPEGVLQRQPAADTETPKTEAPKTEAPKAESETRAPEPAGANQGETQSVPVNIELEAAGTDLGEVQRVLINEVPDNKADFSAGLEAVGALISNRSKIKGRSLQQILSERRQFQGYPYKPGSEYQTRIDTVLKMANGKYKASVKEHYRAYLLEVLRVSRLVVSGTITDPFMQEGRPTTLWMWAKNYEGDPFMKDTETVLVGTAGGNVFYGRTFASLKEAVATAEKTAARRQEEAAAAAKSAQEAAATAQAAAKASDEAAAAARDAAEKSTQAAAKASAAATKASQAAEAARKSARAGATPEAAALQAEADRLKAESASLKAEAERLKLAAAEASRNATTAANKARTEKRGQTQAETKAAEAATKSKTAAEAQARAAARLKAQMEAGMEPPAAKVEARDEETEKSTSP